MLEAKRFIIKKTAHHQTGPEGGKWKYVEGSCFTGPYSVPCSVLKQKTIPPIDVPSSLL